MKPCLIVLNPRRIEVATEALRALNIEQIWVTGYTEAQIATLWPEILARSDATHFLVASDDLVPVPSSLALVLAELPKHPVVTGYCNLALNDDRVNLCRSPLPDKKPKAENYDFYTARQIRRKRGMIRTYFAGMCFTGMSREMWEEFPFDCFGAIGGYASDYHLSLRLTNAGVPIVAPKGAYSHHLKPTFEYASPTLVGQIQPTITPHAAPVSQE